MMLTKSLFCLLFLIKSAGLSSSSALVCCSGLATLHANGLELSKVCDIKYLILILDCYSDTKYSVKGQLICLGSDVRHGYSAHQQEN